MVHFWEYEDPDTGKKNMLKELGRDEFSEIIRMAKSKKWKIWALILLSVGIVFQALGVLAP